MKTRRLFALLAGFVLALLVGFSLRSAGMLDGLAPPQFYTGTTLLGMLFGVGLARFVSEEADDDAFGSSRWARVSELKDFGLLKQPIEGIVLGQDAKGRILSHQGKEHLFLFAPTRSGKGVGLIVPTLVSWPDSTIVIDIKGENWELTAGRRKRMGHYVIRFDPTDPSSPACNPLLEVRPDKAVRDVRNLVEVLAGGTQLDRGQDSYWTTAGKTLLTAFCLHVLYAGEDKSLRGVLDLMRLPIEPDPNTDPDDVETGHKAILKILMSTPHHRAGGVDENIRRTASSFRNLNEKTLSSVWATAESFLTLFEDPALRATTSRQDFRLRDLQFADRPTSLYIVIPPSDLDRLRPLLRLIITQTMAHLTEELDGARPNDQAEASSKGQGASSPPKRHPLLLLLDEFPALGRMDYVRRLLGYCAGYDIRAFIVAQDLRQIDEIYGSNNALLGAAHVRVAFASNDDRTAQRISSLLGKTTHRRKTESRSGRKGEFVLGHRSVGEAVHARDLLTPGEIMQLAPDDELILLAGKPPIRAKKLRYYEDERFLPHIHPPPQQSIVPAKRAPAWRFVIRPECDLGFTEAP